MITSRRNRRNVLGVSALLATLLLAGCSGRSSGSVASGNIHETTGVDDFDGAHWVDFTLPSNDEALELDVICRDDETKIMISSHNTLTTEDGLIVLSRFGDDEHNVPKSIWLTTTSHKSVIYDGDKTAFIRGLLSAPQFKVRVSPVGADTIDTKFSTAGLAEALARHAGVCGWGDLVKDATAPVPAGNAQPETPAPPATTTTDANTVLNTANIAS
jgi:hypothetical protein